MRARAFATATLLTACSFTLNFDDRTLPADVDAGTSSSSGSGSSSSGVVVVDSAAPATEECRGTEGPLAVAVGSFCIDSTAVTNVQYAKFLMQSTQAKVTACADVSWSGDTSHLPKRWTSVPPEQPVNEPNVPVTGVDWCDARSFCRWAGKRLCGDDGGAALPVDRENEGEWFDACTASAPLFRTTTGLVGAWENACEVGMSDCQSRGGPPKNGSPRCPSILKTGMRERGADLGIRCCADKKTP